MSAEHRQKPKECLNYKSGWYEPDANGTKEVPVDAETFEQVRNKTCVVWVELTCDGLTTNVSQNEYDQWRRFIRDDVRVVIYVYARRVK